jgi:hypothetical protein
MWSILKLGTESAPKVPNTDLTMRIFNTNILHEWMIYLNNYFEEIYLWLSIYFYTLLIGILMTFVLYFLRIDFTLSFQGTRFCCLHLTCIVCLKAQEWFYSCPSLELASLLASNLVLHEIRSTMNSPQFYVIRIWVVFLYLLVIKFHLLLIITLSSSISMFGNSWLDTFFDLVVQDFWVPI